MTHHLFGSVRVPSTVNQQDETITPATKANCHDNRSSALGCYPERNPHAPRRPDPFSQYAKETLSLPKYIQWFNGEAAESPGNLKVLHLNTVYTLNPCMMYTGSGSGIISPLRSTANGLKTHSRDTEESACIGFVWRRVGWVGGTYV